MATKYGTNAANTILGGSARDILFGLGGDDTLKGAGGDDTLNGGTGRDAMVGGTGNDVYVVDNVGDIVTEYAGEGYDEVSTSLSSYTLGSNVEGLVYNGAGNFSGYGNSLANHLEGGNGADKLYGNGGNDVLKGGGGADLLNGGTGIDEMLGGTGNDTYVVSTASDAITEFAGEGSDTVQAASSYTLSANVENLKYIGASTFAGNGNSLGNHIVGGASSDTIQGLGGNDTLKGGGGADRLFGGTGVDLLVGGTGNDQLSGGSGGDRFSMAQGDGRDVITDFKVAEGDKLHFQDALILNQFTIFNDVLGNANVAFGNTSVTLLGVNANAINGNFFSFA